MSKNALRMTPDEYAAHMRRFGVEPVSEKQPAISDKRRSGPKLNKTEERCLERLREDYQERDGYLVMPHALVLRFDDGTEYRPDFLILGPGHRAVIECKGGHVGKVAWSRHGIERFRRAKDQWGAWFEFRLWHWHDGRWEVK